MLLQAPCNFFSMKDRRCDNLLFLKMPYFENCYPKRNLWFLIPDNSSPIFQKLSCIKWMIKPLVDIISFLILISIIPQCHEFFCARLFFWKAKEFHFPLKTTVTARDLQKIMKKQKGRTKEQSVHDQLGTPSRQGMDWLCCNPTANSVTWWGPLMQDPSTRQRERRQKKMTETCGEALYRRNDKCLLLLDSATVLISSARKGKCAYENQDRVDCFCTFVNLL